MKTSILEGKTAFVTGVASPNGMGFATAKALAEWGASLGIWIFPTGSFNVKDLKKRE